MKKYFPLFIAAGLLGTLPCSAASISQVEAASHIGVSFIMCLVLLTIAAVTGSKSTLKAPVELKCEYLSDPMGIDVNKPRLSWLVSSDKRGEVQTSYQIIVASTPELLLSGSADRWDSGQVKSNLTAQIVYGGKSMSSYQKCYWNVRVWDIAGNASEPSETAYWEMGLLEPADWKAKWIARDGEQEPNPLFRKCFTLCKPIKSARAFATALGSYRLQLNGKRVGNDILTPDFTDYKKRATYQTYDITSQLTQGDNVVGAILGLGWYGSELGDTLNSYSFGEPPIRLLVQIRVEYTDGSVEMIVTDESWKVSTGPIIKSTLYDGEIYDARLDQSGWDSVNFDDSKWEKAEVMPPYKLEISAQVCETVQITQILKPLRMMNPSEGVYVFDMGENMVGWGRLKVSGTAGTTVRMRFAEALIPGTENIYTENLRRAVQTDYYTLKGDSIEFYEPHFTYHGFRYVEITGFPGKPSLDAVEGCVSHTAAPVVSNFECSNKMVNQLYRNIIRSQRGNTYSIPTDCPQRDERMGWTGDANVFCMTSCFNMSMGGFYTKWMRDMDDALSPEGVWPSIAPRVPGYPGEGTPAWADAGVVIPWTLYLMYGDTRILEVHYPSMVKWIAHIKKFNANYLWRERLSGDYGDWVPGGAKTPGDVLATAVWAYDAWIMTRIARILGLEKEADEHDALYQNIKNAFIKAYVRPNGEVGNGSQTCYVLALKMGLLPDELREKAAALLIEDVKSRGWHLSTGFIGTCYLMPTVTEAGYPEVAYKLLLSETYPSWGYVIKMGATSIWERWDGYVEGVGFQDPDMNSFNHYAFGAVGEWMFRYIGGIQYDMDNPGFRHIIIHPYPGDELTYAKAEYGSILGKIVSSWKKESNGAFILEVSVPTNTIATVYVPSKDKTSVKESGKPAEESEGVSFVKMSDGYAVYQIGGGSYKFSS